MPLWLHSSKREMSIVTLQLGQCGNQIGFEFFDLLSKTLPKQHESQPTTSKTGRTQADDLGQELSKRFFNVNDQNIAYARAVMVDMEQKVIAQTLHKAQKSPGWMYQKGQQVTGKRGSGNNWAQGYCCHGPQSITDVLDKVSKEAEKCDSLGGFIILMSLAGGTGSGLGTFVTTALRDDYPHCPIINKVIWPYATGEVIVQNYNAVLTLSHLYSSSDAIVVMENEKMQQICSQLLKIKNVSFKDINKVVATKLAGVLLPAQDETQASNHVSKFLLADILANVCSHPGYKLLNILNIPVIPKTSLAYTSYNWKMLVKHCRQMLIANANMEEGINWDIKLPPQKSYRNDTTEKVPVLTFNKSLSNQLFLRGKDADQVDISSFQDPLLYTPWVPSFARLHTACNDVGFNGVENSITVLNNSQTPLKPLNSIVNKAWETFASRAYIHQYSKYGISEDDFVDSFVSLEQVVKNYASL